MSTNERRACEQAIEAVERYVYSPTEENRRACALSLGDPCWRCNDDTCIACGSCAMCGEECDCEDMLACLLRLEADQRPTIRGALACGLPEPQAASAARREVRRWSLAGLMGRAP